MQPELPRPHLASNQISKQPLPPLALPLVPQARRQLDTCLDFRGNTLFASVSGKLAS
jgi:hypothetical protein